MESKERTKLRAENVGHVNRFLEILERLERKQAVLLKNAKTWQLWTKRLLMLLMERDKRRLREQKHIQAAFKGTKKFMEVVNFFRL